jgi:hypothetical protein
MVEHLPSKCETLSSKPSTAKKKKKLYIYIKYNKLVVIIYDIEDRRYPRNRKKDHPTKAL